MFTFLLQKVLFYVNLSLIRSYLFIFVFIFIILGARSKKISLQLMSKSVLPMFSSKSFIVSDFTFRSLILLILLLCMVLELQSMGLLRVGHDWVTSLSLFTFMHWRRKWQPTPVFLPGESQGQRSLVGCRLCGRTESDTTEVTQQQQQQHGVRKCSSFILLQVVDQFSQHHLLNRLSFLHCVFLPPLSKTRCP